MLAERMSNEDNADMYSHVVMDKHPFNRDCLCDLFAFSAYPLRSLRYLAPLREIKKVPLESRTGKRVQRKQNLLLLEESVYLFG